MNLINSILLGIGLAMDAFTVSVANGLNEPHMRKRRMCIIAFTYAFFQFAMPLIGWVCVRTVVEKFRVFEVFIPWIALLLLGFIGGKMLYEGIRDKIAEEVSTTELTMGLLLMQGVATSIDALSVGFTISAFVFMDALLACIVIAVVTFVICMIGLLAGRKIGLKLAGRATILGGIILIGIGIEIFIKGVLM
ncbi:MAG: manganese efflux pump [Lachnospiraceae bacterium]|nr:manganese efflux pump [Lachnospiraceae bacterium]